MRGSEAGAGGSRLVRLLKICTSSSPLRCSVRNTTSRPSSAVPRHPCQFHGIKEGLETEEGEDFGGPAVGYDLVAEAALEVGGPGALLAQGRPKVPRGGRPRMEGVHFELQKGPSSSKDGGRRSGRTWMDLTLLREVLARAAASCWAGRCRAPAWIFAHSWHMPLFSLQRENWTIKCSPGFTW